MQNTAPGEGNLLLKVFIFQWMVTLGAKVMTSLEHSVPRTRRHSNYIPASLSQHEIIFYILRINRNFDNLSFLKFFGIVMFCPLHYSTVHIQNSLLHDIFLEICFRKSKLMQLWTTQEKIFNNLRDSLLKFLFSFFIVIWWFISVLSRN
jgi:hypothetical protein